MKKIQFVIHEDDISNIVERDLTDAQIREIMEIIENDDGIWIDIERAIREIGNQVLYDSAN